MPRRGKRATVERLGPGDFVVLWDGKPTDLCIFNGSHGAPGVPNTYGIGRVGDPKPLCWVGTLAATRSYAENLMEIREGRARRAALKGSK